MLATGHGGLCNNQDTGTGIARGKCSATVTVALSTTHTTTEPPSGRPTLPTSAEFALLRTENAELRTLLESHREAGSHLARTLLARPAQLGDGMWLIEPVGMVVPLEQQALATDPVGGVVLSPAG